MIMQVISECVNKIDGRVPCVRFCVTWLEDCKVENIKVVTC